MAEKKAQVGFLKQLLLSLLLLSPALCHADEKPTGPQRIISVAPSITQTLDALGLGRRVVGISTYCTMPSDGTAARVGGYLDPEIETILSLDPDLVMTPPNGSLETALTRFAIPFEVFQNQWTTVSDILSSVVQIGRTCGIELEAQQLASSIENQLNSLNEKTAGQPAVPVLLVVEKQPGSIIAAGPGSHLDELVRFAGGTNVLSGALPYPNIPGEEILRLDPAVIIEITDAAEHRSRKQLLNNWSSFQGLAALASERIYFLHPSDIVIPGPGIGKAAEQLYAVIHAQP